LNNKDIPALKQKAKELYLTGMYCKEVAKIIGCHTETIRRWMVAEGVIRHRGPKSMIGDENYFDNIDSSDKAYWLGWLMADGCVTEDGCIKLNVAYKDKELIDKFLSAVQSTNKTLEKCRKNKKTGKIYKSYWCSLTSTHMVKSLNKLGVIPRKSNFESFPDIPEQYNRDFLRGYFDGDGCVYVNFDHPHFLVSFCCGEKFGQQLNKMFKGYGKLKQATGIMELRFGTKMFIPVFYNYFYYPNCLCLKRKFDIFQQTINALGNTEVSKLLKQFATVERRD
jgi:hypothetical protein